MKVPANPFCEGAREFSKFEDMIALTTVGRLWGSDYPVDPRPMSLEEAVTYMRDRAYPRDSTERVIAAFQGAMS